MPPNRGVNELPTRQRLRPSVQQLTAKQLSDLQTAIGAMAKIEDDRGFQHLAGLHGGPPKSYCQHGYSDSSQRYHGAPLFLPWHRAYLHFFELAMQDRIGEVMLAWWDWTSPQSHSEGIPHGFTGKGNPLAGQPIAKGHPRPKGIPPETWREPDTPSNLPSAGTLKAIIKLPSFMDFSTQLEQQLHNNVHGWVGGAMGSIPIAAFDPIFYAHHCMVDRVWRLWQLQHGQPGPPAASWGTVLEPFPMKVSDVLTVGNLGYDYAGTATAVAGTQ
jgi:tyrosinase